MVFYIIFIGMQIKENVEKSDDTISSDGTAGTRLVAIFIDGILIPWSLGWFKIIQLDVLMIIISILCIIKGKKYFVSFFQKNNWKKEYWFVFWGCTLMFSGIYSFLSFYEIAPCGVVKVYVRVIFLIILLGITSITLPPDSPVAKFATANYKNLYKGDKM